MPTSKSALRDKFRNGLKPSQQDFFDFIDTVLNVKDDLLGTTRNGNEAYLKVGFQTDPDESPANNPSPTPPKPRIVVNGGMRVGGFDATPAIRNNASHIGTIIFDSDKQLKVHDGTDFVAVGSGSGASPWTESSITDGNRVEFGALQIDDLLDPNDGVPNGLIFNANRIGATLDFQVNGISRFDINASGLISMVDLTVNGTFTDNSDLRLKTNIKPFTDGLDLLKKIQPVNYKYHEDSGLPTEEDRIGVIAQEIKNVFPYMVSEKQTDKSKEPMLKVKSLDFIYVLINSVKSLASKVEELEATVSKLQNQ